MHDNGTVDWIDEGDIPVPATLAENDRANLGAAIQLTLSTATLLDRSTKAALEVVYDAAPEVVDNADAAEQALRTNKGLFVDALDGRQRIFEVSAGWLAVDRTLVGPSELKAIHGQPMVQLLDHSSKLRQFTEDAARATSPDSLLTLMNLDYRNLLARGIAMRSRAIARTATEMGDKAPAELVKIPGRIAGATGFALAAADLARAQRLGAIEQDPVYDYVEEASKARSNLRQWLDEHQDLGIDDPDRQYVESVLAELDLALDPAQQPA